MLRQHWLSVYRVAITLTLRALHIVNARARAGTTIAMIKFVPKNKVLERIRLPAHLRSFSYQNLVTQRIFVSCHKTNFFLRSKCYKTYEHFSATQALKNRLLICILEQPWLSHNCCPCCYIYKELSHTHIQYFQLIFQNMYSNANCKHQT